MNLDAVIQHMRTFAPVFEGRVAGAAAYAQAKDQVWLKQPAAYVIPLDDDPSENQDLTGIYQIVQEKVGVIVDLNNAIDPTDRRGQAAASQAVDQIRAALWRCLLNWRPDAAVQARGFAYAGGGLLQEGINRAWLRWQFDFVVETTLTAADGWQPESFPLTEIRSTVASQADGHTTAEFSACPAQT